MVDGMVKTMSCLPPIKMGMVIEFYILPVKMVMTGDGLWHGFNHITMNGLPSGKLT